MQYSFYYTTTDRLIKACRPNHADFYADVLRFQKKGNIVYNNYARVPAQLLSVNLLDAHQVLSNYYEDALDRQNFYRFLMVEEHPCTQFPDPSNVCRSRQHDWVAYARLRQVKQSKRQRVKTSQLRSVANIAARA